MTVHPTASKGFVDGVTYEAGRPDYPAEVLETLGIKERNLVVDLGCGTGKFTRMLLRTHARVIGVEPLPSMLATFTSLFPEAEIAAGVAEALPLRDRSADLITCASAFHWFDHERALPELHRVLRPGGRLALIWNRRDKLTGWAEAFWRITEVHRGNTPGYRNDAWREAINRSPLFGRIEEHRYDYVQRTDLDGLLARVASISFIETLPPDVRACVIEESRGFLSSHPETRNRTEFEMPYKTALYVSRRM